MIGYKPKYTYEESVTRWVEARHAGLPMDQTLRTSRMESRQMTEPGDEVIHTKAFFVSGGTGKILHTAAFRTDVPAIDQMQDAWGEFKRRCPLQYDLMEKGVLVIELVFDR